MLGWSPQAHTYVQVGGPGSALTHSEVQQRLAQASAQQATPDAEAALKALDAYVRELRTVAKIALKGRPQLLEAMGIKAR